MKALKLAAVAAIAVAGLAGAAQAKPALPDLNANKLTLKLCIPHFEKKVFHLPGNKDLVVVFYVNRLCQKKVVYRYVKFHNHGPFFLAKKAA
jgi:hypothetical protein